MTHPYDPDRLPTRALEDRHLVRRFVKEGRVADVSETGVRLDTTVQAGRLQTQVEVPDGFPADAEISVGIWRLDVVSDGVLRVRFADGDQLPAPETRLLTGDPPSGSAEVVSSGDDRIVLRTSELEVTVELKPLMLRVDDHSGRELARVGGRERNWFHRWDGYNTGVSLTVPEGRPLATECFRLRPQEAVYGLGERFTSLDHRGTVVDLDMREAIGTTTPRAYKNVPLWWTTNGYGVFVNQTARMSVWTGSMAATDLQLAVDDDHVDLFIITGNPKTILRRYAELTGTGHLPPQWTFGYWQSKISYSSADEGLDVVRRLRSHDVPVDVLHLDTHWFTEDWFNDLRFDPDRFPDPEQFLRQLRETGVRVCLWQLPYIPEGSELYCDLEDAGAFVKTPDGDTYDVGLCYTPGFDGRVGCIDWTNPVAERVYGTHLRRLFDAGAAVIKVDFGEQAPLDGVYHDGTPGHRMHNLYPLLYNQAIARITEQATGERVIWARSAWTGSQRYPVHWGGDSSANWDNIVPQFRGGLSFGLSGFQFWSQDVGGFLGDTGGDLLVRWMQAGIFCSHLRIHGFGDRELDAFDEQTMRICRDYVRWRYRLLPYLYGQAARCVRDALPFARALVVEYPDDPTACRVDDQWLCGDALLVAPIFDASGRRRVYLPSGTWTDHWTREKTPGPCWLDVETPLERIPLWHREGSVVATGPDMLHVGQVPADEITLHVAPFTSDGGTPFTFAVDDDLVEGWYSVEAGRHTIRIGTTRARISVESLDPSLQIALERRE